MPPFIAGAVKADADDNVWIRERMGIPRAGGPPAIYGVVNREGRLIDRVQLPPSLTLVGFGPGVAYLTSREGTGTVLVKQRIR
jgi:hypothetical protein